MYHLPTSENILLSSHNFHHMQSGKISGYADRVEMNLSGHEEVIQIYRKLSNLLIMFDSAVTSDEIKDIGFHYRSGLSYPDVISLDSFGNVITQEVTIPIPFEEFMEAEFEH